MFIDAIPENEATGAIANVYEKDREGWGYLPNFTRLFSHHPDAYRAWRQLIASIAGQMDRRRFELATLAAARALRSDYCSVAHAKFLTNFYDEDEIQLIAASPALAGLDETDLATIEFAEKAARSAVSVSRADVEKLKELGLSDRDILDVVLAVGARCFFATVIETLGATPDEELTSSLKPDLLDKLLIGRSAGR